MVKNVSWSNYKNFHIDLIRIIIEFLFKNRAKCDIFIPSYDKKTVILEKSQEKYFSQVIFHKNISKPLQNEKDASELCCWNLCSVLCSDCERVEDQKLHYKIESFKNKRTNFP